MKSAAAAGAVSIATNRTLRSGQRYLMGPLSGLRVLDLTTSYAGPTASMYLADLGAEVIKVERPGHGDDARAWGPPFIDGASAWFASANRNKRSIAIDITATDGRAVLSRLIGSADVFIESFNPAKLEALGLEPQSLRAKFPRLIYCAISGWGLNGPDRDLPGYDLAAQARSGLISVTGPLGGAPERVSTALSDIVTGMCAALAIRAAVLRQRESNIGDVIDVSLLDSDLALMAPRIAAYLAGGPEPAPSGGTDSVLAIYQAFSTADRTLIVAIGNDAMWVRFCNSIGRTDLGSDPKYQSNSDRRAHRSELLRAIESKLIEKSAAEWESIFDVANVPCSVVRGLSEVVSDPHVTARGSLLPVPGSEIGLYSVREPFRLDSIPEPHNRAFPNVGGDAMEILAAVGYSGEEITELFSTGAVYSSRATSSSEAGADVEVGSA